MISARVAGKYLAGKYLAGQVPVPDSLGTGQAEAGRALHVLQVIAFQTLR